ncbi:hypothetical protein Nepgr_021039 [Nepenthes gracilis]|uniref:Uncharacterized protein n=1 Tax=Nepenthes gracilis TaxID=150966 RepID=A0AAD3XVS6_NEPGR|nr:hypothetical protein Nepgr_021039 [Nepenthes gracilis]
MVVDVEDAVPKNLALGEALVVCGAPISMGVHTADDKSQYMNLGHAVSCKTSAIDHEPTVADPIDLMEGALHADQAKEGHDPEDTVEHEEVAKECKSSRGLGDVGELKEPSSIQRMKLPVRAVEENGILLVECPFSKMGLDSQPTPSNAMLSMPFLDCDCISSDAEGRNYTQASTVQKHLAVQRMHHLGTKIASKLQESANWMHQNSHQNSPAAIPESAKERSPGIKYNSTNSMPHSSHKKLKPASTPFNCPCFRSTTQQGTNPRVYHRSISSKTPKERSAFPSASSKTIAAEQNNCS